MKREISSVVALSTVAIAPVASGTSASVLSAAAPCHSAKRRRGEVKVLVGSVMLVFQPWRKLPPYNPRPAIFLCICRGVKRCIPKRRRG